MNIYSCCTPSHEILKEKFFNPTGYDDIIFQRKDITGRKKALRFKIDVIRDAVHDGLPFVWSDVDTQFFGDTRDELKSHLDDYDIVFHCEDTFPHLCTGLFACNVNKETKKLWQAVFDHCKKYNQCDQCAVTHQLRGKDRKLDIKWGMLPDKYYCSGIPGGIPDDIVFHHANKTRDIQKKIKELEFIRRKVT